jgi:hypothetical protein
VLNIRINSDQKSFGERIPFNFKVEVDEIHPGRRKPFLVIKYGKVARVLTPEVLQTLRIERFSCVVCKGGKFPEVLGTEKDMDHPIMRTCVHISRLVRKSDNSEELK